MREIRLPLLQLEGPVSCQQISAVPVNQWIRNRLVCKLKDETVKIKGLPKNSGSGLKYVRTGRTSSGAFIKKRWKWCFQLIWLTVIGEGRASRNTRYIWRVCRCRYPEGSVIIAIWVTSYYHKHRTLQLHYLAISGCPERLCTQQAKGRYRLSNVFCGTATAAATNMMFESLRKNACDTNCRHGCAELAFWGKEC